MSVVVFFSELIVFTVIVIYYRSNKWEIEIIIRYQRMNENCWLWPERSNWLPFMNWIWHDLKFDPPSIRFIESIPCPRQLTDGNEGELVKTIQKCFISTWEFFGLIYLLLGRTTFNFLLRLTNTSTSICSNNFRTSCFNDWD